jgi:hypothetical protein
VLSHSWEATSRLATQDFPNSLWNPSVNYRVHKNPPLVPILSQMNPVHTIPSYILRSISILSSRIRLDLSSGLFPCGFPTKTFYVFLFSPMHATCLACPCHNERSHYSPSWTATGQSLARPRDSNSRALPPRFIQRPIPLEVYSIFLSISLYSLSAGFLVSFFRISLLVVSFTLLYFVLLVVSPCFYFFVSSVLPFFLFPELTTRELHKIRVLTFATWRCVMW